MGKLIPLPVRDSKTKRVKLTFGLCLTDTFKYSVDGIVVWNNSVTAFSFCASDAIGASITDIITANPEHCRDKGSLTE